MSDNDLRDKQRDDEGGQYSRPGGGQPNRAPDHGTPDRGNQPDRGQTDRGPQKDPREPQEWQKGRGKETPDTGGEDIVRSEDE
jgi:hypothetical protein